MSASRVVLEVILHEQDADGTFAEWDMWREFDDQGISDRITSGTAGTLYSAIDHAVAAWGEHNTDKKPDA